MLTGICRWMLPALMSLYLLWQTGLFFNATAIYVPTYYLAYGLLMALAFACVAISTPNKSMRVGAILFAIDFLIVASKGTQITFAMPIVDIIFPVVAVVINLAAISVICSNRRLFNLAPKSALFNVFCIGASSVLACMYLVMSFNMEAVLQSLPMFFSHDHIYRLLSTLWEIAASVAGIVFWFNILKTPAAKTDECIANPVKLPAFLASVCVCVISSVAFLIIL